MDQVEENATPVDLAVPLSMHSESTEEDVAIAGLTNGYSSHTPDEKDASDLTDKSTDRLDDKLSDKLHHGHSDRYDERRHKDRRSYRYEKGERGKPYEVSNSIEKDMRDRKDRRDRRDASDGRSRHRDEIRSSQRSESYRSTERYNGREPSSRTASYHRSTDGANRFSKDSNEYKSRRLRRSSSRDRDRSIEARESSSSRKRSHSGSRRRKKSKWDAAIGEIEEGEEDLQIKSFQGGFSSAPPPPAFPPPVAPNDSVNKNETPSLGDPISASGSTSDLGSVANNLTVGSAVSSAPALNTFSAAGKLLTAAEIEFDKKQRRLYIGNLPPGSPQEDVIAFFNGALLAAVAASGTSAGLNENELPVSKCEVYNVDSRFCFLEFRSLQLTWLCLKLDGIAYNGYSLRVGRPHDYVPPPGEDPVLAAAAGFEGSGVLKEMKPATAPPRGEGTDQKIFIQNLPPEMSDEQVKDLLEQFGLLRVLNIIKDVSSGRSKGYGFFEYEDPSVTDSAIQALNGLLCGSNMLCVQRASFSGPPTAEKKKDILVTSLPSSMTQRILSHALVGLQVEATRRIGAHPSKVVQLLNTVFQEDLLEDNEYNEILEEIKAEAEKYGPLKQIVIPRPSRDLAHEGVGKVFLFFYDETTARKAQMMLNGRKFDNTRVVCAAFYPEERFLEGKYVLP